MAYEIHPKNPRALLFSEDSSVCYVPGGLIEAVVHDPLLGPVFYTLEAGGHEVDAAHPVAALDEGADEVVADEAAGPGHEDARAVSHQPAFPRSTKW